MGRFNFKGDVESIGQLQLEFIDKVLVERGFKGPDVLIEQVGAVGDNYMSNVKRIVITENGETFKMIAKLAPSIPMMRKMGNIEMIFHNEHVIYTHLLPKFRELQRSAGVPKEEWFRFAECYGSNKEAPNEVILLEDLKEDNYIMLDRFKPLSNHCVKMVLKNFAIYHSLSYVLKHVEPELYESYKSELKDIMAGENAKFEEMNIFFSQMEDMVLGLLQDEKYKKNVKGNISNSLEHALEVKKVDVDSKYSIIQQGDGWTNNILFQLNYETPKSCVLVDYQMARESNPAFDIMYMLFNSTRHEQRQKQYYEYLDYYHSEMAKYLKYHDLDITSVYPRDQLDADLKRYAKLMLGTCVMILSFIIRKTEDATRFKETMENNTLESMSEDPEKASQAMFMKDKDTIVVFKGLVEGIIDSFLEFGLLQE